MLLDDKRTRPKHYVSLVFLLVAASAAIIPLYWMLVTAVRQPTLTVTFPPEWFPSKPTWINFERFWHARVYCAGQLTACLWRCWLQASRS